MFGARLLLAAVMSVVSVGAASAYNATALSSSVSCTVGPKTYWADYVCPTTGSCTAPSGAVDAFPGHCSGGPATECIDDAPCSGIGSCQWTGVYGFCKAGSGANAGKPCAGYLQCNSSDVNSCELNSNTRPFTGDGLITVLTELATTVTGTSGDDVLCPGAATTMYGGAGNDVIGAGSSNTTIYGEAGNDSLYGGSGNDTIIGGTGDNMIYGNGGNDSLWGDSGDDFISGGTGNDVLVGQGGRDVLDGGDGDDIIFTVYGVTPASSVQGTLLCGGAGNDFLYANGYGHQCLDAGTGQPPLTTGNYDCTYAPPGSGTADVATGRGCAATSGTFQSNHPPCGCD